MRNDKKFEFSIVKLSLGHNLGLPHIFPPKQFLFLQTRVVSIIFLALMELINHDRHYDIAVRCCRSIFVKF